MGQFSENGINFSQVVYMQSFRVAKNHGHKKAIMGAVVTKTNGNDRSFFVPGFQRVIKTQLITQTGLHGLILHPFCHRFAAKRTRSDSCGSSHWAEYRRRKQKSLFRTHAYQHALFCIKLKICKTMSFVLHECISSCVVLHEK